MNNHNQSHSFYQSYILFRNKSFNQRKQSRGTKTNGELTKVEAFRTIKANDNGWSGALPSFTPFHPANYQHALSYRPLRSPCLDPETFRRNFPQNTTFLPTMFTSFPSDLYDSSLLRTRSTCRYKYFAVIISPHKVVIRS